MIVLDRTIDRHVEHPPQARILTEAGAWINRHMEVQARMLAEACAWTFLLRVRAFLLWLRAFKEAGDRIFLLKVQACIEACPWRFT